MTQASYTTYNMATRQPSTVEAVVNGQSVRSDGPLKLTEKQLILQYQQIVTVLRGGRWILPPHTAQAAGETKSLVK